MFKRTKQTYGNFVAEFKRRIGFDPAETDFDEERFDQLIEGGDTIDDIIQGYIDKHDLDDLGLDWMGRKINKDSNKNNLAD